MGYNQPMETAIVLAMHGAPPNDFPGQELAEYFGLHARIERTGGKERAALASRHDELEARMRGWPRTAANDPFHEGSLAIAQALANVSGLAVILGFNEFCAPSLEESLGQAALEYRRVIVVTPMLTAGGEHAGADIPAAIERARIRHPRIDFRYAWPFDTAEVAAFLAAQVKKTAGRPGP
jgi:sirohydrochlorin cobaltochelatase